MGSRLAHYVPTATGGRPIIPKTPAAIVRQSYWEGECKVWPFGKDWDGYGIVKVNGRSRRAHRLVLEWKLKRELHPHEMACHTCDNPSCVRPRHLFVGTAFTNKQDCVAKDRHAYGERRGKTCKLTNEAAREIFVRANAGESRDVLAIEFGVSNTMITNIRLRRSWARATERL